MKRFSLRQGALHEHPKGKWVLHEDVEPILRWLDTTADGVPIVTEGPVFTPDGRRAYIEPFNSTPIVVLKHDTYPDEDEYFEVCECFSTLEAAQAALEATKTIEAVDNRPALKKREQVEESLFRYPRDIG